MTLTPRTIFYLFLELLVMSFYWLGVCLYAYDWWNVIHSTIVTGGLVLYNLALLRVIRSLRESKENNRSSDPRYRD